MIEKITHCSQSVLFQLAGMLARAFYRDPLFQHALPDSRHRSARLPGFFRLNLQYGLRFGEVYGAAENGLAIWLPPSKSRITFWHALQAGMWRTPFSLGLRAVARLGNLNALAESFHQRLAPEPHWYLFLLGVDPHCQGQGLGAGLLEPILARADSARLPCYLETNSPEAIRFYQRLGFAVALEYPTSIPGLRLWAMRREHP